MLTPPKGILIRSSDCIHNMATSYFTANASTVATYLALFLFSYKVVIYVQRLFFHPLARFPGPKVCAASRIYEFYWDAWHQGRLWTKLPELHDKYGPIIRMGPDELHVRDAEYFDYLFSFKRLDKYALAARQFGITDAMFGTEEYKLYTQRRAAFGDAFSRTKSYKIQPLVNEKIQSACKQMQECAKSGAQIDLAYVLRARVEFISQCLLTLMLATCFEPLRPRS